jgi:hypothetical protein
MSCKSRHLSIQHRSAEKRFICQVFKKRQVFKKPFMKYLWPTLNLSQYTAASKSNWRGKCKRVSKCLFALSFLWFMQTQRMHETGCMMHGFKLTYNTLQRFACIEQWVITSKSIHTYITRLMSSWYSRAYFMNKHLRILSVLSRSMVVGAIRTGGSAA